MPHVTELPVRESKDASAAHAGDTAPADGQKPPTVAFSPQESSSAKSPKSLARVRASSHEQPTPRLTWQHSLHEHVEHPELDEPETEGVSFLLRLFGWHASEIDHVPNTVVWSMVAVSWNAVLMAVGELILEILMLAGAIPKVHFRTGFTFLTLLSAILGLHTLADIIADGLETTLQIMRIGLLVEIGLVISDFEYIYTGGDEMEMRTYYRVPFIVLTVINWILLMFVSYKLKLLQRILLLQYCSCSGVGQRRVRSHSEGSTTV